VSVRRLARTEKVTREGRQATDATAVEVLGNVRAMEMAVSLLPDPARAVTVDDLCTVHCRLLENTPHAAWGGIIRDKQNWIGGHYGSLDVVLAALPELGFKRSHLDSMLAARTTSSGNVMPPVLRKDGSGSLPSNTATGPSSGQ